MKESDSKIVADGLERLRAARDFPAARKRIRTEVENRCEEEKEGASFWRRLWLEVKIRREVSARLKKEFPPGALYLATALK